jgi:hypothetical protein
MESYPTYFPSLPTETPVSWKEWFENPESWNIPCLLGCNGTFLGRVIWLSSESMRYLEFYEVELLLVYLILHVWFVEFV